MDPRQALRKQMRAARRALSSQQQQHAGQRLLQGVSQLDDFKHAKNIAIYLTSDGEIDPQSIIDHCWSMGKNVYLPVLDPAKENALLFVRYDNQTPMCRNKYDILEPSTPYLHTLPAQALDLVLLPLVAFDASGNRMGMGGGYYDRTFSFKAVTDSKSKTKLLGLAHELQKVDALQVASWDIPLEGIISDCAFYPAQS